MDTKVEIRVSMKTIRDSLNSDYRNKADSAIFQKLISLPEIQAASTISSYISYKNEVDTHQFINWCLRLQKSICVPKIVHNDIVLKQITSLSDCRPGIMGILEPVDATPSVNPHSIQIYIVPGLAFDVQGYRLGYGKGYYDRLLKDVPGRTIGIGYTDQLIYELPHTKTDIPLSKLVTDQLILSI